MKKGLATHVIFIYSSSLDLALASTSKPRSSPISSEEPSGLSHYRSLYDRLYILIKSPAYFHFGVISILSPALRQRFL
jgi:hypothetical protein